jgi:REP element-mobilizing transposase RayT
MHGTVDQKTVAQALVPAEPRLVSARPSYSGRRTQVWLDRYLDMAASVLSQVILNNRWRTLQRAAAGFSPRSRRAEARRSTLKGAPRDRRVLSVVCSLRRGKGLGHYDLHAYVVMANHVHVLLFPHLSPSRLLQSLQGSTAREANRFLGRTGESFWQAESYDHWVRDQREWDRIKAYIQNNPVTAGLVREAPRRVSARQARVPAPRT